MNWGDVLLATDYKTYIVGGPVVNLKLNREMRYKPQTTDIHVGGPIVNQKLKWGDVLLATDYKIYIVGGPVVNLVLLNYLGSQKKLRF